METEMKDLSRDGKSAQEEAQQQEEEDEGAVAVERSPASENGGSRGDEDEGDDGERSKDEDVEAGRSDNEVVKRDTVVVRMGERKELTGPMRYITCYATVFTFVVMTGGIVWLLMISPPFNVKPEVLPGGGYSPRGTTLSPLASDAPSSSFMPGLDVDEAG